MWGASADAAISTSPSDRSPSLIACCRISVTNCCFSDSTAGSMPMSSSSRRSGSHVSFWTMDSAVLEEKMERS